jgi:hypothetical protein
MYSTVAVSEICNIGTYKGMSILRTYTHIYRGFCTVLLQIFVQVCLCTLFCRCAVAFSTGCYRNVQMSSGNCLLIQALAWLLVVELRAMWFVVVILTLDTRI